MIAVVSTCDTVIVHIINLPSIIYTMSPSLLFHRAKIRNIEATEEAKQKLMKERMKKKDDVSNFVPTNMAVNFVQHSR